MLEVASSITPVGEREFSSITFAGSREQIESAKDLMRSFLETVPQNMRGTELDTIYQFSMQLRPLSKTAGKKESP